MRPTMRRISACSVIVAIGGLLAACGTDSHPAPVSHARSTSASGTPGSSATGPISRRQAVAFAHTVNLRAADLPGFKVAADHEHETAAEKRLEHEALRCAGTPSASDQLAEASSKSFKFEHGVLAFSVSSSVGVARTAAIAAKELSAVRSRRTQGCLSHFLDELFKGREYHGASVSPFSITAVTPSAPGTTGSFGWRISAKVTTHRVAVPVYLELLGFVYGRSAVTLFTSAVPVPFPPVTEQHLFSLLLERATHRPQKPPVDGQPA